MPAFDDAFLTENYTRLSVEARPMFAGGRWGNPPGLTLTETRWWRGSAHTGCLVIVREIPAYCNGRYEGHKAARREVEIRSCAAGAIVPAAVGA